MRRIRSLLVPYLTWNAIYALYAFLMANIPFLNRFADYRQVSIQQFVLGIFHYTPYNTVFWYMNFLMIFVLLAPVLYLLVKHTITAAAVFVFLCVVQSGLLHSWIPDFISVYLLWLTYFLAGAYLALHPGIRRFLAAPPRLFSALTAAAYLLSLYLFHTRDNALFSLLYYGILAYTVWLITGWIRIPAIGLTSCTFFIYASHWLIARNVNKLICIIFNTNAIYGLLSWCILPFLVLGIAALCKTLSRQKWFRPIWMLLNGGR